MRDNYIEKYQQLLEYIDATGSGEVFEAGEEDPSAMGGMPGGDPSGMGGMPGGDPSGMGGAQGGAPADMGGMPGGDPSGMGGQGGPEGFAPQGVDPNAGLPGMGGQGGDPSAMGGMPGGDPSGMGGMPGGAPADMGGMPGDDPNSVGPDDQVIDVDTLVNAQQDANDKIEKMASKVGDLVDIMKGFIEKVEAREAKAQSSQEDMIQRISDKIEQANPTPMQRLSMKAQKSAPYDMSVEQSIANMPDNYSPADDNNGADDPQYKMTKEDSPQYQITSNDVDNFSDWRSAYNDIANKKLSIADILDL